MSILYPDILKQNKTYLDIVNSRGNGEATVRQRRSNGEATALVSNFISFLENRKCTAKQRRGNIFFSSQVLY